YQQSLREEAQRCQPEERCPLRSLEDEQRERLGEHCRQRRRKEVAGTDEDRGCREYRVLRLLPLSLVVVAEYPYREAGAGDHRHQLERHENELNDPVLRRRQQPCVERQRDDGDCTTEYGAERVERRLTTYRAEARGLLRWRRCSGYLTSRSDRSAHRAGTRASHPPRRIVLTAIRPNGRAAHGSSRSQWLPASPRPSARCRAVGRAVWWAPMRSTPPQPPVVPVSPALRPDSRAPQQPGARPGALPTGKVSRGASACARRISTRWGSSMEGARSATRHRVGSCR